MAKLPRERRRKILRGFFLLLTFWFVISLVVGYQYLLFASEKGTSRAGTMVEAIFDKVSYLPYRGNKSNDLYYQSLFFSSCLTYDQGEYSEDQCTVWTDDNKIFYVRVATGSVWSDGVAVSIDDVFFTYNDVIKNNMWNISHLDTYDFLSITKKDKRTVEIVFPFSSVDNKNFFTQYILPKHILEDMNLEGYKNDFARNPVYGDCARLRSTQDSASLLLSLENCENANFLYYQLKSFEDSAAFSSYVSQVENNIITLYSDTDPMPGYKKYNVLTDAYITIFFNRESKHINSRIRRALGGLIFNKFFEKDHSERLYKDQLLFDAFWSDGTNLEQYIINKNPRMDINKDGLERININKIPIKMLLTGSKQKMVHYLDVMPESGKFALYFRTQDPYEKILVSYDGSSGSMNLKYNEAIDRYQYTLDITKNIAEGLNKYTIKGYGKDKIVSLAELDLYYLNLPDVDETSKQEYIEQKGKIKIIYYEDPASIYMAEQVQELLTNESVEQYFNFVPYASSKEFDAKLLSKDYDMVISPFDFSRKKDFSSFLLTDVPTANPSLYTNVDLARYISDYAHKDDTIRKNLKLQINDIYANDMPFVVIGQIVVPFYLLESLSGIDDSQLYTIQEFKKFLFENLQLVNQARLRSSHVFSGGIFREFLFSISGVE